MNLLDVDYIVPDLSLMRDIKQDPDKQKFLSDLVTYSISKGCEIIALGVEDKETLELVSRIGVKYVQGYYFSKPIDVIKDINQKLKELLSSKANESIS